MRGWRGDDVLNGGNGDDELYGGRDADILNGGEGNDLLKGKRGADILNGDGGDDDLKGNRGDDTLDGGEGEDTLDGGNGTDACTGETVTNCEDGPVDPEPELVFCGDQVADVVGTEGDDVLTGTAGPDVIAGLGGNDQIDGLAADDVICGGDGADSILGGDGDDFLIGDSGADTIDGGPGRDVISGGLGDDILIGAGEDDSIFGDDGNDDLSGGDGSDDLAGDVGDDVLTGGPGDDVIGGGEGSDSADGGEGEDICLDIETVSACESEADPADPLIALKALDPDPLTGSVPAGPVTVQGFESDNPAVVVVDSPGGVLPSDIMVSRDFSALARSISDVQAGPVYVVDLAQGLPAFESASITLPYDTALLTVPEAEVAIAKYRSTDGRWVILGGVVDPAQSNVSLDLTFSGLGQQRAQGLAALAGEPVESLRGNYVVIEVLDSFGLEQYRQQLERVADAQAGIGCGGLDPDGPIPFHYDVPVDTDGQYQNIWSAVPGNAGTIWYLEGSGPDFDFVRQESFGALRKLDTTSGQVQIIESDVYVAVSQQDGGGESPDHDYEQRAFISATADGGVILVQRESVQGGTDGFRATRYDLDGVIQETRVTAGSGELLGAVIDFSTDQLYVLSSIPVPGTGLSSFTIYADATGPGLAENWQTVVPGVGGFTARPVLHLTSAGPVASYQLNPFPQPLGARTYASFDASGNYIGTSQTEPAFLPTGSYVEVDRGSDPFVSYFDGTGNLISSIGVTATLAAVDHEFLKVSDIADGVFLLYGTTRSGLPRSGGGTTQAGSFIMAIDPEQFGDQLEVPLIIPEDGDGDGLPDCEELVGLPSMSWISRTGGATEQEPFIVQLSTSTADINAPGGEVDGYDTDEDGLGDGEEIEAFPVSTAPFLSPSERDILLDIGLAKIYKASTLPYEADSDFDGNTDAEELEDGTDPMFPNHDFLEDAIYPTNTILQPAAFGTEPFLSVFAQVVKDPNELNPNSVDIKLVTREIREVVTYDQDYDCIDLCEPWYQQFVDFDPQNPDHVEASREAMRRAIRAQDVFHLDANPADIFVSSSVMQGYLWKNCILLGTSDQDCGGGQIVDNGSGPLPLDITYLAGVAAPAREVQIQSDIVTRTKPILEGDRPVGEQGTRWKVGLGAAALVAAVAYIARTLDVEESPQDTETRVRLCEEAIESGGSSIPLVALGDFVQSGGVAGPHCEMLPVYYPGNEFVQATAHRAAAILQDGHPAILSYRSSRLRPSTLFPGRWYTRLPWECVAVRVGDACDEYPNSASGEAGPRAGYSSRPWTTTNQRSASLCLMNQDLQNRKEGTAYGRFLVVTTLHRLPGAYFIVVPTPTLPTNHNGRRLEVHPVRIDEGSYPAPVNRPEPAVTSMPSAWQNLVVCP